MDFKFDKGPAADAAAQEGQGKGRQTALLAVLLVLLGGFGYLYFFTGIIRPQVQSAPPVQPAPQVVKQPLPARENTLPPAGSEMPGTAPTAPSAAAPTVTPPAAVKPAPVAAAAPNVKTPDAPAVKPQPVAPVPKVAQSAKEQKVQPAAAKVMPQPAAPAPKAVQPAKDQKVQPASAKVMPQPAAPAPKAAQPAKDQKVQPAAAVKVTPPAAGKNVVPAKPVAKQSVLPVKRGGPWTLVVGSYVLEEQLAADIARVKAAGLTPVMTSGQRRITTMHRLKYGQYADSNTAQQAVELLKKQAGGGFSLQKSGIHEVFAGSFAQLGSAQVEQQRLAAAGVNVTIQKSQVAVASRKLTAGTFTDRAAAEAALRKLRQAGFSSSILE